MRKSIKEILEDREYRFLSDFATKSKETQGRKKETHKDNMRTEFQRDRDKILHSKAFRRLKHKTQVFLSPYDDHFRTRLTHTLEVAQIARTISRALFLNEDLTEAIALGHDLGHTPFGHCGEGVLNELVKGGFHHNIQSVRVVEVLEDLNLCRETVDGILTHTWGYKPNTPEAQAVQLADKIAYINHDIEDSIRAGIISENDLPKECIDYFSSEPSRRLTVMISDVINNSKDKPQVMMSEEGWHYTTILREYMFNTVYVDSPAKMEEGKARHVVKELFYLYKDMLKNVCEENKIERIVTDYISGMTDRYAVEKYKEHFIPVGLHLGAKEDYLFKLAKVID